MINDRSAVQTLEEKQNDFLCVEEVRARKSSPLRISRFRRKSRTRKVENILIISHWTPVSGVKTNENERENLFSTLFSLTARFPQHTSPSDVAEREEE